MYFTIFYPLRDYNVSIEKIIQKVYSYKYNITKQVIQSTVYEEIIESIRQMYHKPFEESYNQLKK